MNTLVGFVVVLFVDFWNVQSAILALRGPDIKPLRNCQVAVIYDHLCALWMSCFHWNPCPSFPHIMSHDAVRAIRPDVAGHPSGIEDSAGWVRRHPRAANHGPVERYCYRQRIIVIV